jgi:hydrogenase maturation protease
MPRVLIIAYGNPMRSDDGLAWRAADQLDRKFAGTKTAAEVEIMRCHQLAPELAEVVTRSESVIFLDAAADAGRNPGELRCEKVLLPGGESSFSHQLSPECRARAFPTTLRCDSARLCHDIDGRML